MTERSLIVTSKSEKEFSFLKELLEKRGIDSTELSDEEIEDVGLLRAMVREKKENYIPEADIRKNLES
ncbi:hypothetical protein [Membranihabitans maritimus]|uniref:hypothetical protein n=1 Tax=Membranihabitans maritimus TaxID=2904244 RepID=UPI001F2F12BB|nr:hypothetical protein [Membranihabitans maritimus]